MADRTPKFGDRIMVFDWCWNRALVVNDMGAYPVARTNGGMSVLYALNGEWKWRWPEPDEWGDNDE